MMYIENIHFKNDDVETTDATTLEEVHKLGKADKYKYKRLAIILFIKKVLMKG